jgi:cytochrome c oxidase subunit I
MATASVHNLEVEHAHDEHHHEHHEENFIQKYIFTLDHKMIGKQFLFTGILWAFIGGALSIIFRLQLGFPDMQLEWLRPILGGWITESGKIDPYSSANRSKRYGVWFHEHAFLLVLFLIQCVNVHFSFH